MEIKAKLNYFRIAPRKVRLVANLIQGMDVKTTKNQLKFISKRSAEPLLKLLNSAIANAKTNFNVEEDALFIKKILVNEGPPFKRWQARARGRAFPILKRTSHIELILGVKEGIKVEKPVQKIEPVETEIVKEKETEKKKIKKTKYRAPKEITKRPEEKGLFKKIFRRKSF